MEVFVIVAIPLLILAAAGLIVLAFLGGVVQAFSRTDMQLRLRRERRSDDYGMFQAHFAGTGIPEHVIAAVYDHLSNRVFAGRGFPVRPSDSLREVFDIGPEGSNDLDLLIRALAERTRARYVPRSTAENEPKSVGELVIYLARLPRVDGTSDSGTLLRPWSVPSENLVRPANGATAEADGPLLRPTGDL